MLVEALLLIDGEAINVLFTRKNAARNCKFIFWKYKWNHFKDFFLYSETLSAKYFANDNKQFLRNLGQKNLLKFLLFYLFLYHSLIKTWDELATELFADKNKHKSPALTEFYFQWPGTTT